MVSYALMNLLMTSAPLAVVGATYGSEYDIMNRVDIPDVPIPTEDLTVAVNAAIAQARLHPGFSAYALDAAVVGAPAHDQQVVPGAAREADVVDGHVPDPLAAEAMTMFHRLNTRQAPAGKASVFLVSSRTFPQTLDVVRTRAEPIGIEVVVGDHRTALDQLGAITGECTQRADFGIRAKRSLQ